MIGNYWNSAWRNLMKRKRFSFINIFGLAIGMASALLILTYVTFEFSFDKMHTKYDHIYRVQSTFHEGYWLGKYSDMPHILSFLNESYQTMRNRRNV